MKTIKIVILEIAMLIGICVSAFLLPGSFSLSWFIAIALGVLLTANIILFNALKRNRTNDGAKYQIGSRAYIGWALILVFWVVFLFLRMSGR